MSAGHSQGEKGHRDPSMGDGRYGNVAHVQGGKVREQAQETESVKNLTHDIIHQKIDYEIEFEERSTELSEGRTSSNVRDRHEYPFGLR